MSEREDSYSTDDPSAAVGFQAMAVTERTNTDGNANNTVFFYEMTERVE